MLAPPTISPNRFLYSWSKSLWKLRWGLVYNNSKDGRSQGNVPSSAAVSNIAGWLSSNGSVFQMSTRNQIYLHLRLKKMLLELVMAAVLMLMWHFIENPHYQHEHSFVSV